MKKPARIEIFMTRLAFCLYGKSVYKTFADRLPLKGGENALDFGCGMGTVAYYAAKKLSSGHLTCLDISERWLHACRKTLCGFNNISFLSEVSLLVKDSFDVAYCHFVLHDIHESKLESVVDTICAALKTGGTFVFREPLYQTQKIGMIKRLIEQNGLISRGSRITDIPMMGNALECIYIKQ